LDIIRVRASAMEAAQPAGTCAMAAIIGPAKEEVLKMVEEHRGEDVLEAANFNAPDQTVISGHLSAVNRLIEGAKGFKRTRCVLLPVSSAFHTSLMKPAQPALEERIRGVVLNDARFPVVSNVDAVARVSGEEEKPLLVDQIVKPVLWTDCVNTMRAAGVETFVEIGPGKVLTGLLRRIDRKATGVNVSDPAGIRSLEQSFS
jgi:[acyl-carrier-protein] S-malonyltransferase